MTPASQERLESRLPAKLADCRTHDVQRQHGTVHRRGRQCPGHGEARRGPSFRSLLPIRGKILNVYRRP